MRPRTAMLVAWFLALSVPLGAAEAPSGPQAEDPDAEIAAGKRKLPDLRLELITPRKSYELGEPIEVTMRYTYTGGRKLAVTEVTYDRCGRIRAFRFRAVGENGKRVRDPVARYLGGMCGGIRSYGKLTAGKPYEQKVHINEWLCFDAPGRYTITAESGIVSFDYRDQGESLLGDSIPLESEPLEIRITAPSHARRLLRIAKAWASLTSQDKEVRHNAMRDLRFMVDERAIPLLVQALDDEEGGAAVEAAFGLVSFRDMAAVKAEILKRISDDKYILKADRVNMYQHLLGEADHRASRSKRGGTAPGKAGEARREPTEDSGKILERKLRECIQRLPPVQAAEQTVDGMALGATLSQSEPRNWKLILEHVGAMSKIHRWRVASLIQDRCRDKALIADLKKLAASDRLGHEIRSGAIVALHEMGDDSFRDLVAADLMSPEPVLSSEAHATLGDYKAKEVAQALIHPSDSSVAGQRVLFFAFAASAEDLRGACQRMLDKHGGIGGSLLEALAIKSQEDAFPFIQDALRRPTSRELREVIDLLSRMDFPEAQELILTLFQSTEPERRDLLARALEVSSARARDEKRRGRSPKAAPPSLSFWRSMPTSEEVAGAFFPELLLLYRRDPSSPVRATAKAALATISGIPRETLWRARKEEDCLPRWEAWWRANGGRLGRWGEVHRGLALKCCADKGEYEVGEPIWLTVRFRREAGDLEVKPLVRLQCSFVKPDRPPEERGESFGERGIEIRLPGAQGAIAGKAPRSGAAFRVEVQRLGRFGRPGTYRLQALYDTEGPSGNGADAIVSSSPITFHVCPTPSDVKWTEAQRGLTMGVSLAPCAEKPRRDVDLEIRLKNASETESLALASPWCGEDKPLAFLTYGLQDAAGCTLDLDSKDVVVARADEDAQRERPAPVAAGLLPGQMLRLSASPDYTGRSLRPYPDSPWTSLPYAASKGGKFRLSVTYEVPAGAPLPAAVWRGKLTAEVGEVQVNPPDDRERFPRRYDDEDDEDTIQPPKSRGAGSGIDILVIGAVALVAAGVGYCLVGRARRGRGAGSGHGVGEGTRGHLP